MLALGIALAVMGAVGVLSGWLLGRYERPPEEADEPPR